MHNLDFGKFEAVIFDLDSTLNNTHRYPFVATEWLFKNSGLDSEELMASYLRNLVIRYRKGIQAIVAGAPYRSPFDIVHTAMTHTLEDIEQSVNPALVKEAAQRFKALHLELSTPYDGVIGILENLKTREIKIGLVTNSFEGHARILVTNMGLVHFFSSIVDSGDVKAFKPMKEPFEKVLRDLDVDVSRALYVGDEYYADMVGAKSVGLMTVWINNRGESLEDQVAKYGASTTPDFVLNSITEFGEFF